MTGAPTTSDVWHEDRAMVAAAVAEHSGAQRVMLRLIDGYQRAAAGRPSPCRFFPSCSEYGADAIHVHGAARGAWLTVRRLLRCRPFGPSGFDPVPLPRTPRSAD